MSSRHGDEYTLTARWVFPVWAPPLERGTVTIRGDRIHSVEPHGRRTPDRDLGNAAILPGFVNAHTHLDLSDMRDQAPPGEDFVAWLRAVVAHRRSQTPAQIDSAIRAGLAECLRFGTTLAGDIAAGGHSWDALAAAPLRAVVFHELIGLTTERAAEALRQARSWLAARPATATCRPGLSPHAPYSVRRELFAGAASLGRELQLPLAVHLAETWAELELLAQHSGPLRGFLEEKGAWDASGLAASVAEVMMLLAEAPRLLFVHGNYLSIDDAGPRRWCLVWCPRTHARFGHPPHRFRTFLTAGVCVALGTDSLASNPDLDVLAEARFVCERYPDVPPAAILRMATLGGAEALGWADDTGSLAPGKSADLVVVGLPDIEAPDPHDLVLRHPGAVSEVRFRGVSSSQPPDTLLEAMRRPARPDNPAQDDGGCTEPR